MTLLSVPKQFIFIHIFRVAGNSMRQVLSAFPSEELLGVHSDARDTKGCMINRGQEALWNQSFKFTFIRNPFDWMVSTYMYHHRTRGYTEGQKKAYFDCVEHMNFHEFVKWYTENAMKERVAIGGNKCITLNEFVYDADGNCLLDFVGRYENMYHDWMHVCSKLSIFSNTPLPIINAGAQRAGQDYHSFYNHESHEIVSRVFAKDLELFKYQF